MTKDKKWLTVGCAAALAFYLGWAFPWLWAAVLLLIILVLITPTVPSRSRPLGVVAPLLDEAADKSPRFSEVERTLLRLLSEEPNPDVRRGIQVALDAMHQHHPEAVASPVISSPLVVEEPVKTLEEQALDKEKQELRNINTILYVASFLLVGAAALFVGFTSGIDPIGKFFALVAVAMSFYGVGVLLYQSIPKVRPAAVAFVGTGLALIPFVGLGLYNYVLPDAGLVWWLTSLVGLVAFWSALILIRSELMSYLTLAFVFSLSTASVSVLDAAFVWYFIAILVTGSLMLLVSHRLPSLFPSELQRPLAQNAQLAAPLALAGSLLAIGSLQLADYVLISAVGALHYAVAALGYPADRTRFLHWSAARALFIVFAALLTYFLTDSFSWTGFTVLTAGLVSHWFALRQLADEPLEMSWLWGAQGLVGLAALLLLGDAWNVSLVMTVLVIVSLGQLMRTKRSELAVGLLVALAILPVLIGREALEPALAFKVIAIWAFLNACVFFAIRISKLSETSAYLQTAQAGYGLFALQALALACIEPDAAWTASIFIGASLMAYYSAFVERQPSLHAISNILAIVGTYLLLKEAGIVGIWLPLATAWLLGLLWYGLRWYHELYSDEEPDQTRLDIMFVSSVGILSLAAFYGAIANDTTAIAGALTGLAVAVLIAAEGRHRGQVAFYEMAVSVATLSLQWLVHRAYPNAGLLFYTHWWALSMALTGLLRYLRHDREGAKLRGIVALSLLSVPTGLYALSDPMTYQYLFLLEHVALLVAGLLLQRMLVIRWAAVAIGLALLWLLSSFTYVLLAVVALGLIGLAMRRLMRRS